MAFDHLEVYGGDNICFISFEDEGLSLCAGMTWVKGASAEIVKQFADFVVAETAEFTRDDYLSRKGENKLIIAGACLSVPSVVVLVTAFSIYGGNQSTRREQLNDLIDVAGQAAVVVGSSLSAEKSTTDASSEVTSESYADHCAAVAEQYSLTPRESEVFMCLARGRNAEYIANQLMVSPATVKSHIYHIYQKLGVNSQQRLMDLVEGGEPQEP